MSHYFIDNYKLFFPNELMYNPKPFQQFVKGYAYIFTKPISSEYCG